MHGLVTYKNEDQVKNEGARVATTPTTKLAAIGHMKNQYIVYCRISNSSKIL